MIERGAETDEDHYASMTFSSSFSLLLLGRTLPGAFSKCSCTSPSPISWATMVSRFSRVGFRGFWLWKLVLVWCWLLFCFMPGLLSLWATLLPSLEPILRVSW